MPPVALAACPTILYQIIRFASIILALRRLQPVVCRMYGAALCLTNERKNSMLKVEKGHAQQTGSPLVSYLI